MKSKIILSLAARLCAAIAAGVSAFSTIVHSEAATAQSMTKAGDYPHKPIRIIDPSAAGGATDVMARLIGQHLSQRFGQPVIVDNRPGAGSNLGAEIVAKAAPDGYTLLMGAVLSLASSVSLYPQLGYDVRKDFTFVTLTAEGTFVLVITPSLPAKSVAELIALAKSRPGQLSYGSTGVGGPLHLAAELLKSRAGVDILHVPYQGAAPVVAAIASGEVQCGFPSLAGALPLIKAGRIAALAVSSAKRSKALPDLPTIAESGFPGYDVTPLYGVLGPAGMPGAIVKRLNAEIGSILQLTEVQAKFTALGFEATRSTPERFREIMPAAIEKWTKVIKDAGIKPQ